VLGFHELGAEKVGIVIDSTYVLTFFIQIYMGKRYLKRAQQF
jgi:hypothetical protein